MADDTSLKNSDAWWAHWRKDLPASLVVFLVALPLCMGIALASGAPVATGLVTGIIGGLVVGCFAGSPLQVSGPAAGLTVVCAEVIRDYGMPALGIAVLIGGIFQLAAGLLRLGQWFRAVSPAVVHGMLSGIGVLILSSQFHVMVDDRPRPNGVQNIVSLPESILKGLPLPTWEDTANRKSRLELLQTFSMIHERQGEIERTVQRTVTEHGSEQLRQQETEELLSLVSKQQGVIDEFEVAIRDYEASPIAADNGRRAENLGSALELADVALREALRDLTERRSSTIEADESVASEALAGVVAQLKNHDWAAKVGLLSILAIVLWQLFARRSWRVIPAPLVAVLAATFLAWALSLPILYVEVPEDLRDGLTFPAWTVFEDISFSKLLGAGLLMAVIASAETLLCATAVDQMHTGPRTRYDRELAAQGIGNITCGFLGALPMTGVIVRSAANVQAGAKTRLSAVLHGAWLFILVLAAGNLLRYIPTAALAGILVYTGFKLIDFKGFRSLWRESRTEAAIFLITLVVIVVEDLLTGVLTGIVLSAVKLLMTFSHLDATISTTSTGLGHETAQLSLKSAATFLRLPMLASTLEKVPAGAELHVDFEHLDYIDHACLELLTNWEKQHRASGGSLVIDWDSLHARFNAGNSRAANGTNGESNAADSNHTPKSSAA